MGLTVLGGSWVVISGVISRVSILIAHIRGLVTPLITTHEPPSNPIELPEDELLQLQDEQLHTAAEHRSDIGCTRALRCPAETRTCDMGLPERSLSQ